METCSSFSSSSGSMPLSASSTRPLASTRAIEPFRSIEIVHDGPALDGASEIREGASREPDQHALVDLVRLERRYGRCGDGERGPEILGKRVREIIPLPSAALPDPLGPGGRFLPKSAGQGGRRQAGEEAEEIVVEPNGAVLRRRRSVDEQADERAFVLQRDRPARDRRRRRRAALPRRRPPTLPPTRNTRRDGEARRGPPSSGRNRCPSEGPEDRRPFLRRSSESGEGRRRPDCEDRAPSAARRSSPRAWSTRRRPPHASKKSMRERRRDERARRGREPDPRHAPRPAAARRYSF